MIIHIIKGIVHFLFWVTAALLLSEALQSCSKEPQCARAEAVIERYTLDTVLTSRVVWWADLCYEGKRLPVAVWFRCEPLAYLEKIYYTINGSEVL